MGFPSGTGRTTVLVLRTTVFRLASVFRLALSASTLGVRRCETAAFLAYDGLLGVRRCETAATLRLVEHGLSPERHHLWNRKEERAATGEGLFECPQYRIGSPESSPEYKRDLCGVQKVRQLRFLNSASERAAQCPPAPSAMSGLLDHFFRFGQRTKPT